MKARPTDQGFVEALMLPMLAVLALGLALGGLALGTGRFLERVSQTETRELQALAVVRQCIEALLSDTSPEADSRFDAVWNWLGQHPELSLRELSAEAWTRQSSADSSLYALVNPVVATQEVLTGALQARLAKERDSAVLAGELASLVAGHADLGAIQRHIDARAPEAWPAVASLPVLNVNLADEATLRRAAQYLWTDARKAEAYVDALLIQTRLRELGGADLHSLLVAHGAPTRARAVFGSKSWFWELTLRAADWSARAIISVVPERAPGRGHTIRCLSLRLEA